MVPYRPVLTNSQWPPQCKGMGGSALQLSLGAPPGLLGVCCHFPRAKAKPFCKAHQALPWGKGHCSSADVTLGTPPPQALVPLHKRSVWLSHKMAMDPPQKSLSLFPTPRELQSQAPTVRSPLQLTSAMAPRHLQKADPGVVRCVFIAGSAVLWHTRAERVIKWIAVPVSKKLQMTLQCLGRSQPGQANWKLPQKVSARQNSTRIHW